MIRSQSYCFLGIITIYIFFCLLPLPNTFASPKRSLCRRDQRDALLELKEEIPNHSNNNNPITTVSWNKSVDCCAWAGVECDGILGKVISLKLKFANTSLKSKSGLFKLQHLTNLTISNIQGEIPSSIGNLSHLTFLHLSYNQLVGELPVSIGNLNQLREMNIGDNHLRGNIPTSFANLTKLSRLDLFGNQLSGGDIVLANLTSLSYLDISSNHFKSLFSADLSGLHNLKNFEGYDNSFVGLFPSSLLMVSSLVNIDLRQNQFEGTIDFGNTSSSTKLAYLVVHDNEFDGQIPESISKLVNLRSLDLSHNNFRGRVPRSVSKLVNLYRINLSFNKLEGQVPDWLWRLPLLGSPLSVFVDLSYNSLRNFSRPVQVVDGAIELYLSSNSLHGPIPQWFCNVTYVTLDMSSNHLTGSIPQCLVFNELNLRNNSLSGSVPEFCINGNSYFRSLDVSRNNLVGKLPKSLINCTPMQFLNVRGNKINDTFPFWLGSLRSLMVLVLRSNAFYGPIYNTSGFPMLRIIDISNNNFVGSLPQDSFSKWREMSQVWRREGNREPDYMGNKVSTYMDSIDLVLKGVDTDFAKIYQDFKAIDFSGNRFSGHIPGSIGLLSELRLLNLSGNTFTGNIPPSLANITKLETLDLSRNNLSGEIPQSLGKLSFLSNINFSYNLLQGLVPRSTQFGSQSCSSFLGNPRLYGLEKMCGEIHHNAAPASHQPQESLPEPEEPTMNWIAAAIAFGPGVFCGLVIGHIFVSYKQEWFIAR